MWLCMRQVRNGAQVCKNFRTSISSDSTNNAIVQGAVFLLRRIIDASHSLKKQCLLLLHLATETCHECPQRRVMALKQRLEAVMPTFDGVIRASQSLYSSCMLIPHGYSSCPMIWKHLLIRRVLIRRVLIRRVRARRVRTRRVRTCDELNTRRIFARRICAVEYSCDEYSRDEYSWIPSKQAR